MVEMQKVNDTIGNWMETPQRAAQATIEKYGPPNEVSDSMLVWYDNGPWKRTMVFNDDVTHNFPKPHKDALQNVVHYNVPPDKTCELAQYDGSVLIDRTAGELSARCDNENMNILALNLAMDIINNQRSIDDARQEYANQATALAQHQPAPLTENLQFTPSKEETGDPDQPAISTQSMGTM